MYIADLAGAWGSWLSCKNGTCKQLVEILVTYARQLLDKLIVERFVDRSIIAFDYQWVDFARIDIICHYSRQLLPFQRIEISWISHRTSKLGQTWLPIGSLHAFEGRTNQGWVYINYVSEELVAKFH